MAQREGGSQSMPTENEASNSIQDKPSASNTLSEEVSNVGHENFDVWEHFTKCNYSMKGESKKFVTCHFNEEISRRELANAIILHEYPLSIVDHVGFRRFLNALQPLFKVPCRNTIKNDISKVFDDERARLTHKLKNNASRIAITTDMWTSNYKKRRFMVITAHFVDDEWKLQSRILRSVYVPYPHTKEVLAKVLVESLMDWNVDTNLSTMTLDNCLTNDAMISNLKDKLQVSSLILNGEYIHMRCCAHILNLIVEDGLAVIKSEIEKIRESVLYWTASPKREETFKENARHVHIPVTKKLVLDCPTRWNSTYLMLKIALIYKEVFAQLEQRETQYDSLPSESDWEFASLICDRLKIFYEFTEFLSRTKYPTANLYFFKICKIRLALQNWVSCHVEKISNMGKNMLKFFDKYWDDIGGLIGVAAVFDPQYKMTLIEFYLPKAYGSEYAKYRDKIHRLCYDLVDFYTSSQGRGNLQSPMTQHLGVSSMDASSSLSAEFDRYVMQRKRTKTLHGRTELDHYLDEDVLQRRDDFDILTWWKVQGGKYPILQSIARDLLAIPISTVASKSAFSTSGRLVSTHRSRLNPETIEALMCAQNWLWAAETEDEATLDWDNYATIFDDIDCSEGGCVSGAGSSE